MQAPPKSELLRQAARYRGGFRNRPRTIDPVGPGEESVWDFPRPPVVEPVPHRLRVLLAGVTVADTQAGLRVAETAGAPVYYFPPTDVEDAYLTPVSDGASVCEWKGLAVYHDLTVGERTSPKAAFTYPDPFDDLGQGYGRIAGWYAFYAGRVDEAWIGDVRAVPQPGGFYAGWVTPSLKGPIKGVPGSDGW
ncbi:MAG: DUF427 domain-containing protein [Pseudomonadota bacterium]